MVKIKEAIVVEGRYDKNTLSQIVDAPILETAGFGIFKDKQQLKLLQAFQVIQQIQRLQQCIGTHMLREIQMLHELFPLLLAAGDA